jgi:predicted RNA-binding Zn-ribbon protein involved in translation (DUF1610 family)
LRDLHAAYAAWFASLKQWRMRHAITPPEQRPAAPSPPSWRKRGHRDGFRIVAVDPRDVRRVSRGWGVVLVPKLGWVRFRWSRAVPAARSYRVTRDRADRRRDWTEQVSTDLARRFDLICVEDLDVRALTRSASGTVEQPGHNVRQKAGLNQAILASGGGGLVNRLEHKAPGRVVKIPAAYTSQRCLACGHVAAESRQSQTAYRCVACPWTGNADYNAARNIAAAGQVVAAREGQESPGPLSREPPTLGVVA